MSQVANLKAHIDGLCQQLGIDKAPYKSGSNIAELNKIIDELEDKIADEQESGGDIEGGQGDAPTSDGQSEPPGEDEVPEPDPEPEPPEKPDEPTPDDAEKDSTEQEQAEADGEGGKDSPPDTEVDSDCVLVQALFCIQYKLDGQECEICPGGENETGFMLIDEAQSLERSGMVVILDDTDI